ncbi:MULTISPECIES: hypothetical protein [unclassified Nonomuraea]|uniref:hypothetical protein n=1 Tax=unclassified Nonomuraea TaxID=2593643 RepID=UPI0033C29069
MAEVMVPNPRHVRLKQLLAQAEDEARQLRQAYLPAIHAMSSGTVWTGPTARKWSADLQERQHQLLRIAQRVTSAVEEELRHHPPMVTETMANAIRHGLAGRS